MSEAQTPVMSLAAALAAANAAAETTSVDMSEVSKGGGGERRVLPEGFAFGRLVEYVEFGEHIAEFEGKPKPPAMKFRMAFALWGDTNPTSPLPQSERPDDLFHYIDKEGNQKPSVLRTFDMYLGNNEKARTKLAFDKMNYAKTPGIKSFGQFLGQAFLIPVTRKAITQGANKGKFRNDINWANIMAPIEPISRQPYPIPEMPMELLRYFFFDNPTPETWEALKIEGTNEKGESKDFIRDDIKKAVNFEGSALHIMLGGVATAAQALPVPDLSQPAVNTPAVNVAAAGAVVPPEVPVIAPAAAVAVPEVPFDGGVPAGTGSTAAVVETPAVPVATLPTMPALPVL